MYILLYNQSLYFNFAKKNLIASAISKLYFEYLKIFSVPENTCSCRVLKMLPKSAFFEMYNVDLILALLYKFGGNYYGGGCVESEN